MLSNGVVEHVDVAEDFDSGFGLGGEASSEKHFGLESSDEALGVGVVVGVGAGGHALSDGGGGKEALPYWLPRSLWKIRAGACVSASRVVPARRCLRLCTDRGVVGRDPMACRMALMTSSARM